MARTPAYVKRSMYARTNSNFLVNAPDGWVVNNGPVPWGAIGADSPPVWWQGSDTMNGMPIGPNGPWLNGANSILPSVTRCTSIIVGSMVKAPWRLTNRKGELQARPLWLEDPMLVGTSPGTPYAQVPAGLRLDRVSFFNTWLSHALWWGLGAFICQESIQQPSLAPSGGKPVLFGEPIAGSLRIINPFLIGVDEAGHWLINGDPAITTDRDGRFNLGNSWFRLVVLRGLPPHDLATPAGVLTRHYQSLRIGASVSQYVADLFKAGGVPSGFLKVSTPGLKKADADSLRDNWMEAHGPGPRSVAVLNAVVDYSPVTLNPVDSNVAELVRTSRADIAHAFNLSAVWLDEGQSGLTYNNNSDRRRDLVDITLAQWHGQVSATLSSLFPYGWTLEKDWAAFTSPPMEETIPVLVQAVQHGLMTAQEARQKLGMAAQTGPDPAWRDNSPASKEPQPLPPVRTEPVSGTEDDNAEA